VLGFGLGTTPLYNIRDNSKMKLSKTFIALLFIANISVAQFNVDYSNIDSRDIIDALSFSGIGIFKYDISPIIENRNFILIIEEYAGKNNLVKLDTLFESGELDILSDEITNIRFLTKVVNDQYDNIHLYISIPGLSFWNNIKIESEYVRKHYFVKFEKQTNDVDRKIPLLFFGSEWDSIYNGQETTRFCSLQRIPIDLTGDAFDEMPHFYIISYLLK
jgi:hypothetical protein